METSPPRKSIIDIRNRNEEFGRIDNRTDALQKGFTILALEYNFYIEIARKVHKILDLKENVIYRFFCATFHLQVMLHHHSIIASRLSAAYTADPKSFDVLAPKHREYSYAEREISAIFDSIIYHLSSIYDYMSILINFVCVKDRDKTPKWTQICQMAKNNPEQLRSKIISEMIPVLDQDLVTKLYKYRSRLIHEKADVCRILAIRTGTSFEPYFTCTETVRKLFSKYIQEGDADYAITFIAMILIHETAQQVAALVEALRRSIKETTKQNNDMDPKSKQEIEVLWQEFDTHFRVKLDQFI